MYAVLCLIVFINGAVLGLAGGYFLWKRPKPVEPVEQRPADDELERARKEREELMASQKAFQSMMGYNADIAYGINSEDDFFAGGS